MANILISPSKYVQGAGELGRLGEYAAVYGKKALILLTRSGDKRVGDKVRGGLDAAGMTACFEYFQGECSKNEISRITAAVEQRDCDMVIGIGGGKILDTAKAAAFHTRKPVLICPTIASTDAPCSALSVIYTDDGVFEEYLFLPSNPNLVLMDTEVIAASPARLTISGMGDALATYYEARACLRSGASNCAGGKPTLAAMALAQLCRDTLLQEGEKAALALAAKACTPAVEKVVEANTLLSGLGFESAGLAGAHAIHNGLTVLPECHHMYHGEKVAFGTITQLVLENVDARELEEIILFCVRVGLPVTLEQLGVSDVTEEKLMAVAMAACAENDTLHNMPFPVTARSVCAALKAADAYGRYYLSLEHAQKREERSDETQGNCA